MAQRPVLLGVFAHPDDESFGPGGTLARYAAAGAAVHVIIATDGIAGSVEDPAHLQTHHSLAQVRSAELANAAVALGVTSVWSLRYRDSGMRGTVDNEHPDALIQQPVPALVAELLDHLHRLQPDVIVTHDPFGGYGHPDHIRLCETTTAAFHVARAGTGAPAWPGPRKLYYTAMNKDFLRLLVWLMPLMGQDPRAFGRNKDIDAVEISRWHTPVTTRIDVDAFRGAKLAASQAHASQFSGGPRFLMMLPKPITRRLTTSEAFTRAYPAPATRLETDLLAGLPG